jgi:hypothetical protein
MAALSNTILFRFIRRWWFLLLFAGLIVLAFSIRISGVTEKGFWRDELLTMKIHAPNMSTWQYPYIRALNGWTAWKISRYTDDELLIRLPNIIAGVLCVLIIGIWLRRAFGKWPGIFGMLFLGIATCFVHHTSLCRSYGFLSFFVTLAAWTYWEWTEKPRAWPWAVAFLLCAPAICISRMEGLIVYAALVATAPFLLVIRRPMNRKKVILLLSVLLLTGLIVIGVTWGGYLFVQTVSVKTNIVVTWKESYLTFIRSILTGITKYISREEALFTLHHNFRHTLWLLPVWLILIIGLVWTTATRWRLAVILVLWIIIGQAATHWVLIDLFDTMFDARHIVHTVPALTILFVAGSFAVLQIARKYIRLWGLRQAAITVGIAWLAFCTWQYTSILGRETLQFIQYQRIADWKYAAAVSLHAQTIARPFCLHGHHYDMSYYPSRLDKGSPHKYLRAGKAVYFLPATAQKVESSSAFQDYDVIKIPFEPFPAYVIYPDKTEGTSYWLRASRELDTVLTHTPGHRQIREALWAAWLFSGSQSIDCLTNAAVFSSQVRKLAHTTQPPLPEVWNAAQWTPLSGCGALETWEDGTLYRWSTARRSTLLLPAYSGSLATLTLKALPYHGPRKKNQSVTAWLGTVCLGKLTVAGDWQELQYTVPLHTVPGERRLMLEYQHPASPGNDPRLLALALADIRPAGFELFNGTDLAISTPENTRWIGSGWSHPETWADGTRFRWLEGTTCSIIWNPDTMRNAANWKIEVLPFSVPGKQQNMHVLQGNTVLTNIALKTGWNICTVPSPSAAGKSGLLQLHFSYAASPRAHNRGDDPRNLSAAVSTISRK